MRPLSREFGGRIYHEQARSPEGPAAQPDEEADEKGGPINNFLFVCESGGKSRGVAVRQRWAGSLPKEPCSLGERNAHCCKVPLEKELGLGNGRRRSQRPSASVSRGH